jgi:hypothetical protein
MSRDPFQQLRPGDRIPRSVRAWRELVDVAREAQAKRSGLPAEPASSTDFFPNLTVNVRNQSGAQMIAGELVKVFPPETMGATPAGNKLLNALAIFPAVKPDASTSSYARLLETIGPGLVGKAAVLGWLGSGSATVKTVPRRAPSQRFYAGSAVVGVPYLNTAYWETFVTTYGASQPIPVPFVGLPYNLSAMPTYLPGLESFQATAAERAGGQPLALIQSRYRQQFRGVVRLLFSITRYRSPLKDGPTGRTIGFGYPGLTLNARVESTRLGQVEPLSGTSSQTINPLWMSRHPQKFTVGEFDANFNDFYLPGQAQQTGVTLVLPFSTFNPASFNEPTKWVYRWVVNCWLGGAEMPAYSAGAVDVRCTSCALELMETQRDDTVPLIRDPAANPNPPPPTPSSIATPGGESESGRILGPIEGPVSAGLLQTSAVGFAQRAFQRLGAGEVSTSASSVSGSGAVSV